MSVASLSSSTTPDRLRWLRTVRGTLAALLLAAIPLLLAVVALQPAMRHAWPARQYLPAHLLAEALVAIVAFGTFAVQWYAAAARLGDARARFIGAAFLAVGLLELAHLLAFPGMPGLPWLDSSTERGIVYWLSARLCGVGALLGALAIRPESRARALRRVPLLAIAFAIVAIVLAADYLWISRAPRFFVEGVGLTPLKRGLELLVAGLAGAGFLAYRRRAGDRSADDLALALGLTVLSELCFALYARAYDSFNLMGHAYLLFAALGVFHALFVDAVLGPYRALGESHAELRRLRDHIEGELAVTIRNLEALHEHREDLVRMVSHDLRTPLQVVLLHAERLARLAPEAAPERRAAESIARAGRQMNALIADLVDSMHLESGTVQLAKEPLALQAFLPESLSLTGVDLDAGRVRLEVPGDLPPVTADPARLARVVQNLVGNALKYSPADAPIVLAAERAGGEVVISVADRGPGIAPADLQRVFERFYRCPESRKANGLGLGLYIARLITQAHGGRIWCESTVGSGATFRVALPG